MAANKPFKSKNPRAKTYVPRVKPPTGRAGGYAAPVDTTGMDESMKETLKIKRSKKR